MQLFYFEAGTFGHNGFFVAGIDEQEMLLTTVKKAGVGFAICVSVIVVAFDFDDLPSSLNGLSF